MPSAWLSPLPPAVMAVETVMPVCVGVICVAVMAGSLGRRVRGDCDCAIGPTPREPELTPELCVSDP